MCEYCDYLSESEIDCKTHEGKHIGNGLTFAQYKEWDELITKAAYFGKMVSCTKNRKTEAEFDNAINRLLAFEEKHGITDRYGGKRKCEYLTGSERDLEG